MDNRFPSMVHSVKQILRGKPILARNNEAEVPKGRVPVYFGELQKKRFVVPISYLSHPLFQDLLNRAEEEFGFDHPMGGLTMPCREDAFVNILASQLDAAS